MQIYHTVVVFKTSILVQHEHISDPYYVIEGSNAVELHFGFTTLSQFELTLPVP